MKRYIVIGIIVFLLALFLGGVIWNLAWQVASAIFAFVSKMIFFFLIIFFAALFGFLIWLHRKLKQAKQNSEERTDDTEIH